MYLLLSPFSLQLSVLVLALFLKCSCLVGPRCLYIPHYSWVAAKSRWVHDNWWPHCGIPPKVEAFPICWIVLARQNYLINILSSRLFMFIWHWEYSWHRWDLYSVVLLSILIHFPLFHVWLYFSFPAFSFFSFSILPLFFTIFLLLFQWPCWFLLIFFSLSVCLQCV